MKNLQRQKRVKGFTLLEILAVIATLGIFSTVGIQTYSNYITNLN